MKASNCALFLFVFFMMTSCSLAVKCHSCNSITTPNCGDPFVNEGLDECESTEICEKKVDENHSPPVITRGCNNVHYMSCSRKDKVLSCGCHEPYCNQSLRHQPTTYVIFTLLMLVIYLGFK